MSVFNKRDKVEINVFQTELTRLQDLINFADWKIWFIFILYSIIFWFYFKNFLIIKNSFGGICNIVLLFVIFLLLFFWFLQILLTVFPQRNSNKEPLLYFWHVASLELEEYKEKILSLTDKDFKNELVEQNHTLSLIIENKMKKIRILILVLFLLLMLSFIYTILNPVLILWKQ